MDELTDNLAERYRTMRDAYLKEHTTNTILSAENEALAQALKEAEFNWVECPEPWLKAAHNALSGWRARNPM